MNKPDKREMITMVVILMLGAGLLVAGVAQEVKCRAAQQTIQR